MREVQLLRWCDWCDRSGDRIVATVERVISIDTSKPRLLDLCAGCDQGVENMLTLIEDAPVVETPKRKYAPRKKVAGEESLPDTSCPEVGCTYPGGPNRAALGAHTRKMHGKGLRDYK